jgi:methylated-DNA-[protein]-cysteine S-methyltransferase
MIFYCHHITPIGDLLLSSDGGALTGLYLAGQKYFPEIGADWIEDAQAQPFPQTIAQLSQYFQHQRQRFDLPLNPSGTAFQKQVWQLLQTIPYGQTCSYGDLADRLGQPTASRAVGMANGRNPISIVVPCHRVIARNGKLTGYAAGLDRKSWLLSHEGAMLTEKLGYKPHPSRTAFPGS